MENPLYETSYLGSWIKVYINRVDFRAGIVGSHSVPINQIASVQIPMMGVWKVTLETTGGKKYDIPTTKKKEVQKAIYEAQSKFNPVFQQPQLDIASEITKFNDLRKKGVISQEEFDKKKRELLSK